MIKLKSRPRVDMTFIEGARSIATETLGRMTGYKNYRALRPKEIAAYNNSILLLKSEFDIHTQLRCLEYQSFFMAENFMIGLTNDVFFSTGRDIYNFGPYEIRVPIKDWPNGRLEDIELLPINHRFPDYRHPHHTEAWNHQGYHTCWGDFGTVIMDTMMHGEIVSVFRNLRMYVGRYNASSPLRRLETFVAAWNLEPEKQ